MNKSDHISVLFRYLLVLVIGLFGLNLIYYIFTPLTLYPSYIILKIFYSNLDIIISSSTLVLSGYKVALVDACIAGSAYLLLLMLNFVTPMSVKTRIKSLIYMFSLFLVLNILRIVIFSSLYFSDFAYFDITHKFVWYFVSTLMVLLIWFSNVFLFKIKSIPGYSDIKNILSNINRKRSKRKSF